MSAGVNWPARRQSPNAFALTVLVHIALLVLFVTSMRWRVLDHPQSTAPALIVQLWHDEPTRPRPAPARPPHVRHAAPPPVHRHAPSLPAPVAHEPGAPPLAAVAPLPPASAASAPPPLRLDADTLRRAVGEATREPSIGELAARASDEPRRLTPTQKFGDEVAHAARGNCAKGEFAGGGMGLLSLPFLVAAEVSGKCAP